MPFILLCWLLTMYENQYIAFLISGFCMLIYAHIVMMYLIKDIHYINLVKKILYKIKN